MGKWAKITTGAFLYVLAVGFAGTGYSAAFIWQMVEKNKINQGSLEQLVLINEISMFALFVGIVGFLFCTMYAWSIISFPKKQTQEEQTQK